MKAPSRFIKIIWISVFIVSFFSFWGCSTSRKQSSGTVNQLERTEKVDNETAPPVVLNPHVEPQKISLTQDLDSSQPVDIFADVKSYGANLDKVRLRLFFSPDTEERMQFFRKPIEVEMKHVGGTTWKAHLTGSELGKLAINGETLKYQGQVYAQNDHGQITVSGQPIEFSIKAPVISHLKG